MAHRSPQKVKPPREKDLRGTHPGAPGIGSYPYTKYGEVIQIVPKRRMRKGYWLLFAGAVSGATGFTIVWAIAQFL